MSLGAVLNNKFSLTDNSVKSLLQYFWSNWYDLGSFGELEVSSSPPNKVVLETACECVAHRAQQAAAAGVLVPLTASTRRPRYEAVFPSTNFHLATCSWLS